MSPTRRCVFLTVAPAKRMRTMNTTRVFCGIIVDRPQFLTIVLNFRNSSKTCGSLFANSASSANRPHECHMFAETNFAPHVGHVQSGGSCGRTITHPVGPRG